MENIATAFSGNHAQQQQAAAATQPGMLGVGQSSYRSGMFDGVLKPGKNVDNKVLIFQAQLAVSMGETGCLEAVESPIPTRIGREGCSKAASKAKFWEGLMAKALTAWNVL